MEALFSRLHVGVLWGFGSVCPGTVYFRAVTFLSLNDALIFTKATRRVKGVRFLFTKGSSCVKGMAAENLSLTVLDIADDDNRLLCPESTGKAGQSWLNWSESWFLERQDTHG